MELEDSLQEFAPVAEALERLKIEYQLGGSVASSAYGFPRGTQDVDVEINLLPEHVEPLVKSLEAKFLITVEMVWEALRVRGSFNLIPFSSLAKIDVFVRKNGEYDREAGKRRQFGIPLDSGTVAPYWVNSAEDVILRKLIWYRLGDEISEQKWKDVLGVLKAQQFDTDFDYLRFWANELRISDLLERAFDESGLKKWLDSEK